MLMEELHRNKRVWVRHEESNGQIIEIAPDDMPNAVIVRLDSDGVEVACAPAQLDKYQHCPAMLPRFFRVMMQLSGEWAEIETLWFAHSGIGSMWDYDFHASELDFVLGMLHKRHPNVSWFIDWQ